MIYSENKKNEQLYRNALIYHCIYKLFDSHILLNKNDRKEKDYLLCENSVHYACKDEADSISFCISQLAQKESFFMECTNHQSKAKYFLVSLIKQFSLFLLFVDSEYQK